MFVFTIRDIIGVTFVGLLLLAFGVTFVYACWKDWRRKRNNGRGAK